MDHNGETNNRAHRPGVSKARPNMYKFQLLSTEMHVTCFFGNVEALKAQGGLYHITPFTTTRAPWDVHDVHCNRWSCSKPAILGNIMTEDTLGSTHNIVTYMHGMRSDPVEAGTRREVYYTKTPVLAQTLSLAQLLTPAVHLPHT